MSFSVVFMTVDVRLALKFSGGGVVVEAESSQFSKTCLPWEMLVAV